MVSRNSCRKNVKLAERGAAESLQSTKAAIPPTLLVTGTYLAGGRIGQALLSASLLATQVPEAWTRALDHQVKGDSQR